MMRSSVDLPPPLGPSSAVSEPVGTSSDTSSSATASPKRFEMDSTSMLTPPPSRARRRGCGRSASGASGR